MAAIVPETVYTKTAKGILEARNKAVKLPRDVGQVFLSVDGKATVADLLPRLGLATPQLHQALNTLVTDGYIKAVASTSQPVVEGKRDEVDFVAAPALSQLSMEAATHALAEAEASKEAQNEARTALDARLRAEAEARARALAEIRMQAEAEARAKAEAAARAAAYERSEAEKEAGGASDPAARASADARARTAAAAAVRAEAEARARSEAEGRARALVEEKKAAEERAQQEAQLHEKAQEHARARAAAEARAREAVEARISAMGQAREEAEKGAAAQAAATVTRSPAPPEVAREDASLPQMSPMQDDSPLPEVSFGDLAQKLTAKVHAERRARDEAERRTREGPAASPADVERSSADAAASFPSLQLSPLDSSGPAAAPVNEPVSAASAHDDLPTLSLASNTGAPEEKHTTPGHVPSALERAMTQTAARAEAESEEKKATAAALRAAKTAPNVIIPRASAAAGGNAGAADAVVPTLADDEPLQERLNVDRAAHDIMAETAAARREHEPAQLNRKALAVRRERAEEAARATAAEPREKKGIRPARAMGIALMSVPVAAAVFLQFVPLNAYIPDAQKALSERLSQPTTISTLRYVLLPSPRLVLEGVRIGSAQDIRVDRVEAHAWPMTIASEPKVFDLVDAKGVSIDQAMLGAIPSWTGGRSASSLHVSRLRLADVKLSIPDSGLSGLNGDIVFEPNGTIQQATLSNEKLKIELTPRQSGIRLVLNARDWRAPFGPPVPFGFLSLDGVADKQHFSTTELSGRIGGGAFSGTLAARWEGQMIAGGEFKLVGARIDELIPLAVPDLKMRGILSASGRYALQADSATGALGKPLVEATFSITRGELSSFDLLRAIQSSSNVRGGRTSFDELSGSVNVNGHQYSYRQLQLTSGPLNARGAVEVANGQLNGRVEGELQSRGALVARSAFRITGSIKELQLVR